MEGFNGMKCMGLGTGDWGVFSFIYHGNGSGLFPACWKPTTMSDTQHTGAVLDNRGDSTILRGCCSSCKKNSKNQTT